MCIVFNILILVVYAIELDNDYDVILDKSLSIKSRKKYVIKLIIATITIAIALMALYKIYGLNSYNLSNYLRYGQV